MTDWPVKTLGDLMTVQNGYAFDSQYFSPSGKIGLIRIRDLKGGVGTETHFVGPYDDEYVVNAGDYLIGMDGEFRCYEWKGDPALLNQRVCRLRGFGKSLDARFLFYGINKFLKEIEDVTGYTTVKHLSSKSILAIEMPVPPLNEQKRLVALLDAATARVTELTACYEQARTHANNLFTSALSSALEGNPDWPVKTLGEVCDLVGGGTPSKDRPDFYGGDIPWATVRDLNVEVLRSTEHSITAEALTSSSSNVIPKGSVVIATRVGLGKAVIVAQDTAINQDLRGLVVKNPKELLADYLFWWYLSTVHLVVAAGTGATVQGVKLPFVSGLVIPVPTLEEQKRIVTRLDLMKAKTSEMVSAYDAKLTAAKNLRQSILESAFTGQL
jgi:type I restriction enzyme S subunit